MCFKFLTSLWTKCDRYRDWIRTSNLLNSWRYGFRRRTGHRCRLDLANDHHLSRIIMATVITRIGDRETAVIGSTGRRLDEKGWEKFSDEKIVWLPFLECNCVLARNYNSWLALCCNTVFSRHKGWPFVVSLIVSFLLNINTFYCSWLSRLRSGNTS